MSRGCNQMSQYSGTPAGARLASPVKVFGGDFSTPVDLAACRATHGSFYEALCTDPSSGSELPNT
jgi:hypothetical protein